MTTRWTAYVATAQGTPVAAALNPACVLQRASQGQYDGMVLERYVFENPGARARFVTALLDLSVWAA